MLSVKRDIFCAIISCDSKRACEMREKGGRGVPFVDIEGTYIPGYAPEFIKQSIEDRRRH